MMMEIVKKLYLAITFALLCTHTYSQGVWDKVTDHPTLNGLYAASANTVNNKVYVTFGLLKNGSNYNQMYEYDPSLNSWTNKQSCPGIARYGSATFVIGNIIYYVGGSFGRTPYLDELWAYDTQTNTWTSKRAIPGGGRIHAMGFSINDKGYVLGGAYDNTNYFVDFWQYDPLTDRWFPKNSLPTSKPARVSSATFVLNNKAYLCGGLYDSRTYSYETWEYEPILSIWTQKTSLPSGKGMMGGIAFTLNGKGYYGLGAGVAGSPYGHEFYEYNISSDKWTRIADFTGLGRYYAVSFVVNNQAYVGLGNSDYATATFESDFWRLSFPVNPDTLSIRGKIHQGNAFLKNGKVLVHNLTNDFKYSTYTDDRGNFLFDSLSLGEYILKAIPKAEENYYKTFYPNTSDSLKTVKLTLGGSITEIDMYMNSSKTDSDSFENISGHFNIFPNPFENTLKVVSSNKDIQFRKIHILNITGGTQQEIILNEATHSCDIHMDNIKQGMYILKIETQSGIFMKKITKK